MSPSAIKSPLTLVVLISGNGSNLQAIIDAMKSGRLQARIAAVVSNRDDVYGLERAQVAHIPTVVASHGDHASREAYDAFLADTIDSYQPDLVVLAGFMRILSSSFVQQFADRIINIHPSLLPALKGTDTHQRAIDLGYLEHGASVHVVTAELDAGPVILQTRVPVLAEDDAATLAARVLEQEHLIYSQAIQWIAEGKVHIENGAVLYQSGFSPNMINRNE